MDDYQLINNHGIMERLSFCILGSSLIYWLSFTCLYGLDFDEPFHHWRYDIGSVSFCSLIRKINEQKSGHNGRFVLRFVINVTSTFTNLPKKKKKSFQLSSHSLAVRRFQPVPNPNFLLFRGEEKISCSWIQLGKIDSIPDSTQTQRTKGQFISRAELILHSTSVL